ncbi:hypothetical protein ACIRQF_31340 [Streptomyces sp. NPDC101191]|uniref:hypothetical protein n=1 Tax=Streptomyces sp. NPDC101191 TaxID=3366126 RepID=UPI00380E0908
MTYVVLHNRNTGEDFRYEVPTREAQALIDLASAARRPIDWAVKEASTDLLVPGSLAMD